MGSHKRRNAKIRASYVLFIVVFILAFVKVKR